MSPSDQAWRDAMDSLGAALRGRSVKTVEIKLHADDVWSAVAAYESGEEDRVLGTSLRAVLELLVEGESEAVT